MRKSVLVWPRWETIPWRCCGPPCCQSLSNHYRAEGTADDLFYDAEKKLVYVSCGEGMIDVVAERDPDHHQEVVRIPTAPGALTALWVPELNQLFLAVPSRGRTKGSRTHLSA